MKLFDDPVDKAPDKFTIKGREIVCTQCKNDQFVKSYAQLNTAGMTLLGLDFANKSAVTLTCTECGQILWFMEK